MFVSLFGCPIITREPLDRFPTYFDWELGRTPVIGKTSGYQARYIIIVAISVWVIVWLFVFLVRS